MSRRFEKQYSTPGVLVDPVAGIMFDFGTAVPADGAVGYGPGAIFIDNDAAGVGAVFRNVGTAASVNFDSIMDGATIGSATITSGTVTTLASSSVTVTGPILANSTVGMGYATGAGGSVTQTTTRATSVTLNKPCGTIQTDTTSLAAAGEAEFKVANSLVAAGDNVIVNVSTQSTKGNCIAYVRGIAAGAFTVGITNLHATEADDASMAINFALIKGVTS